MLETKEVTVKSETYTVSEIRVGDMLPILPELQKGGEEAQDAQITMMKLCIHQKGKPIGDEVLNLSMAAYIKLSHEVMEINGLEVEEKEPGKD